MPFDELNLFSLDILARILTIAPSGEKISTALDTVHKWISCAPDADWMALQALQYESYHALVGDAVTMDLQGEISPRLSAALHASQVLEAVRDGTKCNQPTLEQCELTILPHELRMRWWNGVFHEEAAEDLVFETIDAVIAQTRNFPLALELTQYLVTYCLALELERLPETKHPRKETARCIKLAKYCIPWEHCRSAAFLCHVEGEVFLMDGQLEGAFCEDYLSAILQLERRIPFQALRSHLKKLTAVPRLDVELEKAVGLWLSTQVCKPL